MKQIIRDYLLLLLSGIHESLWVGWWPCLGPFYHYHTQQPPHYIIISPNKYRQNYETPHPLVLRQSVCVGGKLFVMHSIHLSEWPSHPIPCHPHQDWTVLLHLVLILAVVASCYVCIYPDSFCWYLYLSHSVCDLRFIYATRNPETHDWKKIRDLFVSRKEFDSKKFSFTFFLNM